MPKFVILAIRAIKFQKRMSSVGWNCQRKFMKEVRVLVAP